MSDRPTALPECRRWKRSATRTIFFSAWCLIVNPAPAALTNSAAAPLTAPPFPDASVSVFRVFGALALVIGIFLGGVWLFKNWQRVARRGGNPRLNVFETRSLGGRTTLHVVGYDQERFLIASSPNGANLLSHLPAADAEGEEIAAVLKPGQKMSFAQAFTQVLKNK